MTKKTSKITKEEQIFQETFGLHPSAAAIYFAVLRQKQIKVSDIARLTSLRRTTLYPYIDELVTRQFLTKVAKGRRTIFTATPPDTLLTTVRSRVDTYERLLPQLLAIGQTDPAKPRILYYEGIDGIKSLFADTLTAGREIVGWSDYEYSMKRLPIYFEQYAEERSRRNIMYKVIARDTPAARDRAKKSYRHLREVRLSAGPGISTDLYIYNNKVAHVSFHESNMFAVIIEDEHIAQTMKSIWQVSWEQL